MVPLPNVSVMFATYFRAALELLALLLYRFADVRPHAGVLAPRCRKQRPFHRFYELFSADKPAEFTSRHHFTSVISCDFLTSSANLLSEPAGVDTIILHFGVRFANSSHKASWLSRAYLLSASSIFANHNQPGIPLTVHLVPRSLFMNFEPPDALRLSVQHLNETPCCLSPARNPR